jgi:hypothetical protein
MSNTIASLLKVKFKIYHKIVDLLYRNHRNLPHLMLLFSSMSYFKAPLQPLSLYSCAQLHFINRCWKLLLTNELTTLLKYDIVVILYIVYLLLCIYLLIHNHKTMRAVSYKLDVCTFIPGRNTGIFIFMITKSLSALNHKSDHSHASRAAVKDVWSSNVSSFICLNDVLRIRIFNSMLQSPYWETESCLAGQEITLLLWDVLVYYCVLKSLP